MSQRNVPSCNVGVFFININKMFLYISKNPYIHTLTDIFITSSTVLSGIVQAVIFTGYILLGPIWFKPIYCNVQPCLITYFHSIGITSIIYIFTISVTLLSSHNPTHKNEDDQETNENRRYTY